MELKPYVEELGKKKFSEKSPIEKHVILTQLLINLNKNKDVPFDIKTNVDRIVDELLNGDMSHSVLDAAAQQILELIKTD